MKITIYSSGPVPVEYTEVEFRQIINEYISGEKREFLFSSLCSYIIERAIKEGKVTNAKTTQYSSYVMTPSASYIVSKILWDYIFDRKLFIAFGKNPYASQSNDDTRFIINH